MFLYDQAASILNVLAAYQDGYTKDTIALTRLLRYQQVYSKQCDYSAFPRPFQRAALPRARCTAPQLRARANTHAFEAQLGYKHMRLALGYGHAPVVGFFISRHFALPSFGLRIGCAWCLRAKLVASLVCVP
ncbi:hypothetical protein SPRG_15566 [Saprolegnia parasitica CBS 223.65]|uniref:Uncharacterized protein n=1 Tax=Saprolegnia parasitica (strain CBS 223.65) TaxID=695850 RepID=A0A067BWV9_SAPPC|nr:hypothetical protein SPRG_15566 [Saprolegnia parasitica CBS 223.65]KDO18776.1 hypothetical protein SPRG_15566 [Saprolegnia parasitica CBS 223.65]|eukprot:XP_012210522.1 hypothetical protein SPRG_15566 [Saprolegnia parasitica CBS 223.65]